MDENLKRRYDALEVLRKAAHDSFDTRRTYEWKFCLAVWTPYVVFIGALVTQPQEAGKTLPVVGWLPLLGTAVISLTVAVLHCIWLAGLGRANRLDRLISYHYEKEMREKCLAVPFPPEIKAEIDKVRPRMGYLNNWSHGSQITISFLLALAAILAMAARI